MESLQLEKDSKPICASTEPALAGPPKLNVSITSSTETPRIPPGNDDNAPYRKAVIGHRIDDPHRPKARWEFDSDAKFERGTCKRGL
jgi:hypothetical protein